MTTLREIRKRIRTVKNIAQVTQAMQAVSATKMRRAQLRAVGARPYAERSQHLLAHLVEHMTVGQMQGEPLLAQRPVHQVDLLLVTADHGLCGGYNHNVIQAAEAFVGRQSAAVRLVTVGAQGRDHALQRGLSLVGEWSELEHPTVMDIAPIARLLIDDQAQGIVEQVWIAYTEFVNTLIQRPKVRLLLPIASTVPVEPPHAQVPHRFEPGRRAILGPLLRRITELQVYTAILESQASEHSARMVAMHSASENAQHLIGALTLGYNRVRQETITKEITDIVGGAAALRK